MKISILGGGAWGVTLAQVLDDNHHEVLVYDVKLEMVNSINNHQHPFFKNVLAPSITATTNLAIAKEHSEILVICVPTKATESLLKSLLPLSRAYVFINVSKGINPDNFLSVGEQVKALIPKENLQGYVNLTGPSHAEEVIERKLTLLVASSKNQRLAKMTQSLFTNNTYLRVYTSKDVIGSEVCASAKNAMAVIAGILGGMPSMGENARAALITRGLKELLVIIKVLGGKKKTVYGLTGIGDLIVTATSYNSRNYRCGLSIAKGMSLDEIFQQEKQTIEGVRSIEALHRLSINHDVELPIISVAYAMLFEGKDKNQCIKELLMRALKDE
ncbi:MAG: NAD(P)H-dependent glycerol-3-phosphate dehydrogenase [Acholeplasmatales bacterium]|jgi:glycerol-3-phosphate dehydrogenase (NAD(P)+)|nr:NAD(P)H-dependent glycerol-3-phosphate dehydrogenase [Acholeplasmatales bacterium]